MSKSEKISEKPILFSGPMVRAILDGRKSMTRRVVKHEIPSDANEVFAWNSDQVQLPLADFGLYARKHSSSEDSPDGWLRFLGKNPYGWPGDRLYVKEASWRWGRWVQQEFSTPSGRVKYRFEPVGKDVRFEYPGWTASRNGSLGWVYRHARYMPRSDARILLEITDIRVERLQEITEEDAIAEGRCPDFYRKDDDNLASMGIHAIQLGVYDCAERIHLVTNHLTHYFPKIF